MGNSEKVRPVGLGEATIAFGNVVGISEDGLIQLINQDATTAYEALSPFGNRVREVDRLLVGEQLFEGESYLACPLERE